MVAANQACVSFVPRYKVTAPPCTLINDMGATVRIAGAPAFGAEGLWQKQGTLNIAFLDPLLGAPLVQGTWANNGNGMTLEPPLLSLPFLPGEWQKNLMTATQYFLPQHLREIMSGCVIAPDQNQYKVVFEGPHADITWKIDKKKSIDGRFVTLKGPLMVLLKTVAMMEAKYEEKNWLSIFIYQEDNDSKILIEPI